MDMKSSSAAIIATRQPLTQMTANGTPECAACHKAIRERYLLKALDQLWHEDCLKCACCDCRLGEVGSTLFTKANLILCKRDYLRLFGTTGLCSACNKTIPAFEMVMRVRGGHVYHCDFCIGDRFYLYDNRILCEYDYDELVTFGSGAYNSLDRLKKQTESLASPPAHNRQPPADDASSGYGSPDSLLSDGK
ncbi:unnamed protein product [Oppiella nova]|uniref:LIM zinc-binding domain-containing protein n=1 Tax=Oppiella nova TaxID=334625 RepID=A0A7R9LZN6_9ACAR|nr:unnamed protein product [Oppiella nova]CAG2168496.1 unnamed protein product [Oppiella nova]